MDYTFFKNRLRKNFEDFEHKMNQSRNFQIQEFLSQKIIAKIKENPAFVADTPELAVFDDNANKLQNTGKTYKNVLEEKLFSDGYRIFEEYLNAVFSSILTEFYDFLKTSEKDDGNLIDSNTLVEYVFKNPNIVGLKAKIVEKRVKTYLQSDNIITILKRFETTFKTGLQFDDADLLECQRMALIRNIMMHNNSIVNEIFIQGITSLKITEKSYEIGQSVLPDLNEEINLQRILLSKIAVKINNYLGKDDKIEIIAKRLAEHLSKIK